MSEPEKKKNLTPELRILVASLLSMGVILLWARFFAPKPVVVPPQANRPAQSAPPSPNSAASSSTTPALPRGTATAVSAAAPVTVPAKSDAQERTIVVENGLYRVEFSNHGGVVKSWQLKHYMDDAKPPRVLDVVHPDAAAQTGGWPFAVVLDDAQLESVAAGPGRR